MKQITPGMKAAYGLWYARTMMRAMLKDVESGRTRNLAWSLRGTIQEMTDILTSTAPLIEEYHQARREHGVCGNGAYCPMCDHTREYPEL